MSTITLTRIAADIAQLSLGEQLWLMEQLAHRIRERALPIAGYEDNTLVASPPARIPGLGRGTVWISDDFDAPLGGELGFGDE